eukprot:TRINITY_DN5240_c0_g1_i1.p2 TRINITY_DN5240_c0_g1~~TRINITY_DN5240_c0_g1_i1.p2  ORF type:complete len:144 (+),score=34.19 TRINITY_DN5240_c0_g1_i1:39-434(+)
MLLRAAVARPACVRCYASATCNDDAASRRLLFGATRRGTKEMCLLLGAFTRDALLRPSPAVLVPVAELETLVRQQDVPLASSVSLALGTLRAGGAATVPGDPISSACPTAFPALVEHANRHVEVAKDAAGV